MMLKQLFTATKAVRLSRPVNLLASQRFALFSEETTSEGYENIIVDRKEDGVALITLNRPKALNALCYALFQDLHQAMTELDKDQSVKAIVLTGS